MTRILLTLCLFLNGLLYSQIIETKNFHEITKHVSPETLVILDIDDTLLIAPQMVGTDVWFRHRLNELKKSGTSPEAALDRALAEWEAIRHLTKMEIVEEGTDKIIHDLQTKKVPVMGLTTQGLALSTRTNKQLKEVNIDLCKTSPCTLNHHFMHENESVLFYNGILFTCGTSKGDALLMLLDEIGYRPKHILFINDKHTHLEDVEKSLVKRGIPFTGLRYSYRDQQIANFSPEIANIQWQHSSWSRLLSDAEAEAILKTQKN